MLTHTITTYGPQALAEGAHSEVDIVFNPAGFRGTATTLAQYAHGVRFIDQQIAAVLAFYLGKLL